MYTLCSTPLMLLLLVALAVTVTVTVHAVEVQDGIHGGTQGGMHDDIQDSMHGGTHGGMHGGVHGGMQDGTHSGMQEGVQEVQEVQVEGSATEVRQYFRADYFSGHIPRWEAMFNALCPAGGEYHFLEVGSLEGRATSWLLENVLVNPKSSITCVDTWKGDANLPKEYLDGAYERFLHNTSPWSEKVIVRVGESGVMLRSPELMKRQYSFIYIDGGHTSKNAMEDLVLSFPLLEINGVMIVDDYLGGPEPYALDADQPKAGVDAFLKAYAGRYKVLQQYSGYQLFFQKIRD